MKKNSIWTLIVLAISVVGFCILFAGCGSEEDASNEYAGTWNMTGVEMNGEFTDIDTLIQAGMKNTGPFEVKEDGTATFYMGEGDHTGTFEVGDDGTLTFKDETRGEDIPATFEDGELIMTFPTDDSDMIFHFVKASADSNKDSTETTAAATNGEYITIKTDMFNIEVPPTWEGHYSSEIRSNKDGTYILSLYNTESKDAGVGGDLTDIMVLESSNDYTQYPSYSFLGKIQTDAGDYNIVALMPTDVRYTDDTKAQYEDMTTDLDTVFRLIKGANGYTIVK